MCVLNVCDLSWQLFNGQWGVGCGGGTLVLMGFAWRHVWDMQMVVEEERRSVVGGFPGRSTYSVPGHRKTKIEQIPDKLEFGLVFFSSIFFYFFGPFLCQRNLLAFFLFSFRQPFFFLRAPCYCFYKISPQICSWPL